MKKAVIFLPIEDINLKSQKLPSYINQAEYEFEIVHCHKIQTFVNELSIYTYPTDNEFPQMEEMTVKILSAKTKELGIENFKVNCFFDNDPKHRCLEFLKNKAPEFCALISSHKNSLEMLFEGSFMNFMNKYAPCDVVVLREKK